MAEISGFRKELNFRELGGYTTIDDRTIKKGLIYRSGALGLMNEEELALFKSLRIRTIIDFRSKKRRDALPDPVFDSCEQIQTCAAFENIREDLNYSVKEFFRMLVDEDQHGNLASVWVSSIHASLVYSNEAYKEMFRRLLNRETPLLIHCTQGKDRTGIGAILILLALGVNEKQIEYDYMLSNEYRKEIIQKKIQSCGPLPDLSENFETAVIAKEGVIPEASHMILAEIQERYDTYEAFLYQEYGLCEEDLSSLREYYLESAVHLPDHADL